MHPFIDALVAGAEGPATDGRSLADKLRDSFDPKWKSYDGALIGELATMIDSSVKRTPMDEVRAAYNVVAEWNDVDLLEEGEELGGPYSDMFIDVVLRAIQGG
jgi:hypothetical protein